MANNRTNRCRQRRFVENSKRLRNRLIFFKTDSAFRIKKWLKINTLHISNPVRDLSSVENSVPFFICKGRFATNHQKSCVPDGSLFYGKHCFYRTKMPDGIKYEHACRAKNTNAQPISQNLFPMLIPMRG
jgi:hypothetical protein